MELETLYIKKLNMNSAKIIFDDIEKALRWEKILDNLKVQNIKLIYHEDSKIYFGFNMFRCRYQMTQLLFEANRLKKRGNV